MNIIWDCETYSNCFQLCAMTEDGKTRWSFEISDRRNDLIGLKRFMLGLAANTDNVMVGFNSLSFDYPILHNLMMNRLEGARSIYDFAQRVIASQNKFEFMVRPSEYIVKQVDLLKS